MPVFQALSVWPGWGSPWRRSRHHGYSVVDTLIASVMPFILCSNYAIMPECGNVYCWQMLICDVSFYMTQLVKEVGLLRLMLEKLSHLCYTSSCNTFISTSSRFSPCCIIAWLSELNKGSFHLVVLLTAPQVLLLSYFLAISVDFNLRELLCSHMQPSTVTALAFIR